MMILTPDPANLGYRLTAGGRTATLQDAAECCIAAAGSPFPLQGLLLCPSTHANSDLHLSRPTLTRINRVHLSIDGSS